MTVDEIVQKIYEERYVDPKDAKIAAYMRDGMIREVVERALELATGGLAIDLVAARHAHNATWAMATAWMQSAKARGELTGENIKRAPEWVAFSRAESAWAAILAKLDAWIADQGAAKP